MIIKPTPQEVTLTLKDLKSGDVFRLMGSDSPMMLIDSPMFEQALDLLTGHIFFVGRETSIIYYPAAEIHLKEAF